MKLTKNELLNAGFKENYTSSEEAGTEHGYYYYTFEINKKTLLISNASDECDDDFTVEFFDFVDSIRFTDINSIKKLVKLIMSNLYDDKKN